MSAPERSDTTPQRQDSAAEGVEGAENVKRASEYLDAAQAAENGGRWQEAERFLRLAVASSPASVEAHVKLGILLEEQDRLEESAVALKAALATEERQPVLTLLGSVQRRLGDDEGAVKTLERSVELDPTDDDAHHGLALAVSPQDPERAARHFAAALELVPTRPYSARELGQQLWRLRRFEDAEAACRRGVQNNDEDAWAHCYLGNVLMSLGRPADAEAEFVRAAMLEADCALFWARAGAAAAERGRATDAEQYFMKAIAAEMDDGVAAREYGIFLKAQGRLSTARRYLERSLQLDPENERAKRALRALNSQEEST